MSSAHVKVWRGRRWIDGSRVWVSQCQDDACGEWWHKTMHTTHAAALADALDHCDKYTPENAKATR